MLEINKENNEINNLGSIKVGHLYENIKFQCNDDVNECSADFHSAYLEIIKNAVSGNYDSLNQLIDDTFGADLEVLEKTLKDSKNMTADDKKKFFFNAETGKIEEGLRNYIKIIYMERILFDILNIGLNDLTKKDIKEILKSKRENRINNFIASMTDNNVMIPKNNNGFKTDYTGRVQDKKNFLRYVICFHFLKKSLPYIEEEINKLKSYCYTEDEISKNNELIEQTNSKLETLTKEIVQLEEKIKLRQEELDKPKCLLEEHYKLQQKSDQNKLKDKQAEENKLDKKLIWLKHVNFISEKYDNELESAQHILKDIQKNRGNAFHQFIYLHMLENPDKITELKKRYGLSIWDFMDFLLKRKEHPNFNRALYEIDKAKCSKDFQDEEGDKRTKILKDVQLFINNLNENQRKLVNDLFNNGYSDDLENSWMRKAFWILFAGISLFVVIATAPLLAIIIPDVFMGLVSLLASVIGVIVLWAVALNGTGAGAELAELLLCESWKGMSWLTFKTIPIIPYYCSTFFFIAIAITAAFLIGAVAFYIYKKHQFNSMIKVPNLQQQQIEKSPLELQLENFKNEIANSQEEIPNGTKENLLDNVVSNN